MILLILNATNKQILPSRYAKWPTHSALLDAPTIAGWLFISTLISRYDFIINWSERFGSRDSEKQMKLGTAFQTKILIHHSWLWFLTLGVVTLYFLEIEPLLEAVIAALLIFGSALLATLVRVYTARRVGVCWHDVMLFPLGAVTERKACSTPRQELRIASAELAVYAILALLFGWLWSHLPMDVLGIEMEIVALFNVVSFLFALFLRLSPRHDNLLHALLTPYFSAERVNQFMSRLNSLALGLFAVGGVLALAVGWWAFGVWFAVALTLSQVAGAAEKMGEYREDREFAQPREHPFSEDAPVPTTSK